VALSYLQQGDDVGVGELVGGEGRLVEHDQQDCTHMGHRTIRQGERQAVKRGRKTVARSGCGSKVAS
jgi:hypothetical protein